MALAGSLGLEFAVASGIGLYLGFQLDRFLGTPPVFLILLGVLGAAGGLYLIVTTVRRFERQQNPKDPS